MMQGEVITSVPSPTNAQSEGTCSNVFFRHAEQQQQQQQKQKQEQQQQPIEMDGYNGGDTFGDIPQFVNMIQRQSASMMMHVMGLDMANDERAHQLAMWRYRNGGGDSPDALESGEDVAASLLALRSATQSPRITHNRGVHPWSRNGGTDSNYNVDGVIREGVSSRSHEDIRHKLRQFVIGHHRIDNSMNDTDDKAMLMDVDKNVSSNRIGGPVSSRSNNNICMGSGGNLSNASSSNIVNTMGGSTINISGGYSTRPTWSFSPEFRLRKANSEPSLKAGKKIAVSKGSVPPQRLVGTHPRFTSNNSISVSNSSCTGNPSSAEPSALSPSVTVSNSRKNPPTLMVPEYRSPGVYSVARHSPYSRWRPPSHNAHSAPTTPRKLVGTKGGASITPQDRSRVSAPISNNSFVPSALWSSPSLPNVRASDANLLSHRRYPTAIIFDPEVASAAVSTLEPPQRLMALWQHLTAVNLSRRCQTMRARKATLKELQTCHSEKHIQIHCGAAAQAAAAAAAAQMSNGGVHHNTIDKSNDSESVTGVVAGVVGSSSNITNAHTAAYVARLSVGGVIDAVMKMCHGELLNGVVLARPASHLAERDHAINGQLFNYVAIAAKTAKKHGHVNRVLVLDWGVEHGAGTQAILYNDPSIVSISLHQRGSPNSSFAGEFEERGDRKGAHSNVNVAWTARAIVGDAEMLAAFRTVVMPIARSFRPDIVVVSARFDGFERYRMNRVANLVQYRLSAECYATMTGLLMQVCGSKVLLVVDDGYEPIPLSHCVATLLGDAIPALPHDRALPNEAAMRTLEQVVHIHEAAWPALRATLPSLYCSHFEFSAREREELARQDADTTAGVEALTSLSVGALTSSTSSTFDSTPTTSTSHPVSPYTFGAASARCENRCDNDTSPPSGIVSTQKSTLVDRKPTVEAVPSGVDFFNSSPLMDAIAKLEHV